MKSALEYNAMLQHRFFSLFFAAVLLSLSLGTGCALMSGGNGPLPKAKGYEVIVPSGWKEDARDESDKAYRLPSGSVVSLNSSCTKNISPSLEVLTKHLLFGSRNIEFEKREELTVSGAQGMYSQVKASFEGTPIFLHLFVLPKKGCVFDFSLMNRRPIREQDAETFLTFVKSFRYQNKESSNQKE